MKHEDRLGGVREYDREPEDVTPAKLSLVGGFVGTVSGLKRGGPGGAVLGGLVGGTAGYVTGAALSEAGDVGPRNDGLHGRDDTDGPIRIDVDEEDDDMSDATDRSMCAGDEDSEHDGKGNDQDDGSA